MKKAVLQQVDSLACHVDHSCLPPSNFLWLSSNDKVSDKHAAKHPCSSLLSSYHHEHSNYQIDSLRILSGK
eukprot:4809551-Amphidinium_carterae.1